MGSSKKISLVNYGVPSFIDLDKEVKTAPLAAIKKINIFRNSSLKIIVFISLLINMSFSVSFSLVKAYNNEAVQLTLACFPNNDNAYKVILAEFAKAYPNITVNLKVLGYDDHHNMLVADLAAGKGAPDVAMVEIGYVSQLVAGGGFVNLMSAPFNAGQYKKDFPPFKWAQASLGPRNLFAMPIDVAPGCAWYRKDLFDAKKVRIESIKSLDDLYKKGQKFVFSAKNNGKVDHWLLSSANYIFNMIFYSSSQRYFNREGRPVLKSERIRQAVVWAKKFRDGGLDANIDDWSNEWYSALKDGTVAYTVSGAWLGGHLKNWMAPEAKGKFRVAELPSLYKRDKSMRMNQGGSFLAIPSQIPDVNKPAAWELVKWISTRVDSQLTGLDKSDIFPAYIPAWKDKVFNEGIEYLGGQKARQIWINIAQKVPEAYVHEKDSLANGIMNMALTEILDGRMTIDEGLDYAQKDLESKMEK